MFYSQFFRNQQCFPKFKRELFSDIDNILHEFKNHKVVSLEIRQKIVLSSGFYTA